VLRVATRLAPSTIPDAGVGLFAAAPIPVGTVIWCFDEGFDLRLPVQQVARQAEKDPLLPGIVGRAAYIRHNDPGHFLWFLDDGRFINHSPAPNLVVDGDGTITAARDIAAGEEMFADYDSFCLADPVSDWKPGDGGK
jgi:uncharacterized protein